VYLQALRERWVADYRRAIIFLEGLLRRLFPEKIGAKAKLEEKKYLMTRTQGRSTSYTLSHPPIRQKDLREEMCYITLLVDRSSRSEKPVGLVATVEVPSW